MVSGPAPVGRCVPVAQACVGRRLGCQYGVRLCCMDWVLGAAGRLSAWHLDSPIPAADVMQVHKLTSVGSEAGALAGVCALGSCCPACPIRTSGC